MLDAMKTWCVKVFTLFPDYHCLTSKLEDTPPKRFVPRISDDEEFSCCLNIIRVQVGY